MQAEDQPSVLTHLVDSSPVVMYRVDLRTNRVTYVSGNVERLWGYSVEETAQDSSAWLTHMHPDDRAAFFDVILNAFRERAEHIVVDYRALKRNDGYRWVQTIIRFEYDEAGNPLTGLGYSLDITDRKQAEDEVRRSEARFLSIFRSNPAAIAITLLENGRLLDANESFARLSGYKHEELVGRSVVELGMWPESLRRSEVMSRLREDKSIRHLEFQLRTRSGEMRDLLVSLELAELANELCVLSMAVDITELKRTQQEMRQLYDDERSARRVAETLRAASLAITESLNLQIVLERLLDYLLAVVPYDSANVMLLNDDLRLTIEAARGYERFTDPKLVRTTIVDARSTPVILEVITNRRSVLIPDVSQRPDWVVFPPGTHVRSWLGVPIVVRGEVIGLYSVDKARPGFFTAAHLQMARLMAGQAGLAIANARLFEQATISRERLRHLTQKVFSIQEDERRHLSRELHDQAGQTLAILKNNLASLEADLPDERGQIKQDLAAAVEMINRAVGQIRDLARGLRPPAVEVVGLGPTLDDYCLEFSELAGLDIEYKSAAVLPQLPGVFSITLYRVLQEALTNVVKHARATRVQVALDYTGRSLTLAVEDDGQGFDKSKFARISGGIGLLGMQERVALLGGRLTIESQPGRGTRLAAELPIPDAP